MLPIAILIIVATGLAVPADAEDIAEEKEAPRAIAVVTHVKNEIESISRSELARIFMKQQTTWPGGERCIPIDQRGESPIRQEFSRLVLQRSVYEMKRFWMQETMTGNAKPPIALESAATVRKYLEKLEGAVAYIYRDEVDASVKVLTVSDMKELARPEEEPQEQSRQTEAPKPVAPKEPAADHTRPSGANLP